MMTGRRDHDLADLEAEFLLVPIAQNPDGLFPTALKFPGFCDLVSGFLRLVTVWLHVGRGGVTGSDGP